ncbi:MAG: aspartate aminotransferase family protein, partial [Planctomycetes bacterium]|nr:aspartate aminotransferase family protein [Planctomycetota bacterium]
MAARRFSLEPKQVPRIETRYRRIRTPLPVPESLPLLDSINQYEPDAMTGMAPVIWDRAEACSIFDPYGNMWLDWTSGVLAANAGHGRREIVEAVKQ